MCVQRLWGLNPLRDQKAACRQIEIWSFPALQVSMCMCVSKSERMWKEADPDTYLALPPWLLHVHGASQCRDGVQLRDLWSDSLSCGCPCVCGHLGGAFHKCHSFKKAKNIGYPAITLWTTWTLNCHVTGLDRYSSGFIEHAAAVLPVSTNVLNLRYLLAARANYGCSKFQVSISSTTEAIVYLDSKAYSILFYSIYTFDYALQRILSKPQQAVVWHPPHGPYMVSWRWFSK